MKLSFLVKVVLLFFCWMKFAIHECIITTIEKGNGILSVKLMFHCIFMKLFEVRSGLSSVKQKLAWNNWQDLRLQKWLSPHHWWGGGRWTLVFLQLVTGHNKFICHQWRRHRHRWDLHRHRCENLNSCGVQISSILGRKLPCFAKTTVFDRTSDFHNSEHTMIKA